MNSVLAERGRGAYESCLRWSARGAFAALLLSARPSAAQPEPAPPPAAAPEAAEAAPAAEQLAAPDAAAETEAAATAPGGEAEASVEAETTIAPPVPEREAPKVATEAPTAEVVGIEDDFTEQKNGFRRVRPFPTRLDWSGGLELDVGYAQYTFEQPTANETERVYDFRGRFVFGPTLEYRFGGNWFFAARGEGVLWVREVGGVYQINVDDVFAQVGMRRLWDFKIGRFRTWRVYHKGLGFDLFTLEDSGACIGNPCDSAAGTDTFGPHTYEVSYIYDRETAGHAAVHVYPTSFLAFEAAGVYGKGDSIRNTIGARGAGVLHFDFLRVSAAGEYRIRQPALEATTTDAMGNVFTCPRCNFSSYYGYGGGAELTIAPVEVGLNAAQGHETNYSVTNGAEESGSSNKITSLGGYGEFDVGKLALERSLIVGFGLNRTEVVFDNDNFRQHYQYAGYVAYGLGFNNASVKLVVSRADLTLEALGTAAQRSAMTAGRVRLTYPF